MKYRLAVVMGVSSIGWAVVEVNEDGTPLRVENMGVRKYHNGREDKSQAPLAEHRRFKRSARKLRMRFVRRRTHLINELTRLGLMPAEMDARRLVADCKHPSVAPVGAQPYALRAAALDRALPPYALGRALFALNQRRGFKSNRLVEDVDKQADLQGGSTLLEERIRDGGFRTAGEYFADLVKHGSPVRDLRTADSMEEPQSLAPTRRMCEHEFKAIRQAQEGHHKLSGEDWDRLFTIVFHQRPLAAIARGKCQFYGPQGVDRVRAYSADPWAQTARAWQDINHLKIDGDGETPPRFLSDNERRAAWALLRSRKSVTFKTLAKTLELPDGTTFNLESAKDGKLLGLATDIAMCADDMFGPAWTTFKPEDRTRIVELLQGEPDEDTVLDRLISDFGLDDDRARRVCALRLEQGTSRFSVEALQEMTSILSTLRLDKEANRYASVTDALKRMGQGPAKPEGISECLGYYARMMPELGMHEGRRKAPEERLCGVIGNPTVHIGLNQLRKVVNALLQRYGHPASVAIELGRELKQNRKEKVEWTAKQKRQRELRAKMREDCAGVAGVNLDSHGDWLKYRLWSELAPDNRCCVYTGRTITRHTLFTAEVQVSYILPRSRSMDDGIANLVLATKEAVKAKGDLTPWELYAGKPEYDALLERVATLPANKRWRFTFNALERLDDENGWLDGLLNDRRYLAKVAGRYLAHICTDVTVSSGRLTAKARHQWLTDALPEGSAADYRRVAVDAVAVALLSRGAVRLAQMAARRGDRIEVAEFAKLELACPITPSVLHANLKRLYGKISVSHRPDHGADGALHQETALPHDHPSVIDPAKRVRLVAINHQQGTHTHTKFFDHAGIHRLDLWWVPGVKAAGKVVGVPFYVHEASGLKGSKPKQTRPSREASMIACLRKGDCIRLDRGEGPELGVVRKISPSNGNFAYTPINEIARPAPDPAKGTTSNYRYVTFGRAKAINLRKVSVDVLGVVKMDNTVIAG